VGNLEVQGSMAWLMEPRSYVKPEYGFDLITADDVEKYPDFQTRKTCKAAIEAPPTSSPSQPQADCWSALQSPHPPPRVQEAREELLAAVRCRCDGDGPLYSCSLAVQDGGCGNAACSLSVDWKLSDKPGVCKGLCRNYASVCRFPDTVLKLSKQQPRFCRGLACTSDECCDDTNAVCATYPGDRDTGGTCKTGHCFDWRGKGKTICRKEKCNCKHGYCARAGKCYSADTTRHCSTVKVPCDSPHSVEQTGTWYNDWIFGKNTCVCKDGYCSVNGECKSVSTLVDLCTDSPYLPECSQVNLLEREVNTGPMTNPASALSAVMCAVLMAALIGGILVAGGARHFVRRLTYRSSRGEALLSHAC